jgi:hypothetical protein
VTAVTASTIRTLIAGDAQWKVGSVRSWEIVGHPETNTHGLHGARNRVVSRAPGPLYSFPRSLTPTRDAHVRYLGRTCIMNTSKSFCRPGPLALRLAMALCRYHFLAFLILSPAPGSPELVHTSTCGLPCGDYYSTSITISASASHLHLATRRRARGQVHVRTRRSPITASEHATTVVDDSIQLDSLVSEYAACRLREEVGPNLANLREVGW